MFAASRKEPTASRLFWTVLPLATTSDQRREALLHSPRRFVASCSSIASRTACRACSAVVTVVVEFDVSGTVPSVGVTSDFGAVTDDVGFLFWFIDSEPTLIA